MAAQLNRQPLFWTFAFPASIFRRCISILTGFGGRRGAALACLNHREGVRASGFTRLIPDYLAVNGTAPAVMQLDIELGKRKHIIVKDTLFENVPNGSSLYSVLNLLMALSLGTHLSQFILWIACAWVWSFLVILEPRLERAFLASSPKGMVSFLCLLFVLNLGLHKGAQTWSSVLKGNTLPKRIVYSCRALVIGHLGFIESGQNCSSIQNKWRYQWYRIGESRSPHQMLPLPATVTFLSYSRICLE